MKSAKENNTKLNFWTQSASPLFMLAPMEDVTDTCFREMVMNNSQKDNLHVVFTEFLSTDGMVHPKGRVNVAHRLFVSESERKLLQNNDIKIVAQIWGNDPEKFYRTIKIIQDEFDFDGIDINMGCPVKNVVAHGSCSALIDNEKAATEIIDASRQASQLPISVKTRLGVKIIETDRWLSFLLKQPLDAIILHGRIQKQMSDGEANWNEIGKAATLRNEIAPHIKIIGNGDVTSLDDARKKMTDYGVDGAMIGRGIFKNPWLFGEPNQEITTVKKCSDLLTHLELYEKNWGSSKNFAMLRRFFKIYLSGFDGAAEIRHQMMETKYYDDARATMQQFCSNFQEHQHEL